MLTEETDPRCTKSSDPLRFVAAHNQQVLARLPAKYSGNWRQNRYRLAEPRHGCQGRRRPSLSVDQRQQRHTLGQTSWLIALEDDGLRTNASVLRQAGQGLQVPLQIAIRESRSLKRIVAFHQPGHGIVDGLARPGQ